MQAQLQVQPPPAQSLTAQHTELVETIHAVATLVTTFLGHVQSQQESVGSLLDAADDTVQQVDKGNRELEAATAASGTFRYVVFCLLVGMSITLLSLDYFRT